MAFANRRANRRACRTQARSQNRVESRARHERKVQPRELLPFHCVANGRRCSLHGDDRLHRNRSQTDREHVSPSSLPLQASWKRVDDRVRTAGSRRHLPVWRQRSVSTVRANWILGAALSFLGRLR